MKHRPMKYRRHHGRTSRIAMAAAIVLLWCLCACGVAPSPHSGRGMIILGIDGMDPKFLERHWDELPNLDRLRREGDFKPLATTIPPQSPVAWSSVITGLDPGGHGIFDFIHRDPVTRMPFSSMAETIGAGQTLAIGEYVLPLSSPEVRMGRQGEAFWPRLARQGIPTTIFRMPTNFPPIESEARQLSGMGTPDMHGTYGTFAFFTDDPDEKTRGVSGGKITRLAPFRHHAEIAIEGPANTFKKGQPVATATLVVDRDPGQPVARFTLGEEQFVLKEGEWSEWLRADFPLLGDLMAASGIFRVYLKQVRPRFELYVTPINLDPSASELPISTPAAYSEELAEALGPFYTQGMAEDTSAFRQGVLNLDEFLAQSWLVLEESRRMLRYELERYEGGLLFFYVSSIDQNSHMLWGRHDDELLAIYRATDQMVGEAMEKAGADTTLIVMSDHGFTSFDRAVHLNTVLLYAGLLALDDPSNTSEEELFPHVDWSRTQAYAMGLNSIYLNRLGRERGGIVSEGEEARDVIAKINKALTEFVDPGTGERVIEELYLAEEIYQGFELRYAPDLLVGYRPRYRASWKTPLGAVPEQTVIDNDEAWIGDHCVAPQFVPGVLLSNRKITADKPKLTDVPVTILSEFGLEPGENMLGRKLF